MALPKLNDTPKYDIVIPSTKTKTRFRPYLVKEEKVLLLAVEDGDEDKITQATIDLIKACVDLDIDERDLTTYDMDYLFCQIRSKSVGETVDMTIACEDETCNHRTDVKVDLSKVGVDLKDRVNNMIELTQDVTVEMKHLSYYDILDTRKKAQDDSEANTTFDTIVKSIRAVHTADERIDIKEEPYQVIEEFLDNLTSKQYKKLSDFVLNTPTVSYDVSWDCGGCGKHQTLRLAGLQDFFLQPFPMIVL